VLIEDMSLSACDQILQGLNGVLGERFAINHTTVQFEHVGCAVSESGCVIPASHAHHQH
jgi:cobalt-zinc-cadmium efflux system protein